MIKRVFAVFLILTLLMSAVVLRAVAAGEGYIEISDYDALIANEMITYEEGVITIPEEHPIKLTGTLRIPDGDEITIGGGGVIMRGDTFKGALIEIPEASSLTIKDIAVDGGASWSEDVPTPITNSGVVAEAPAITNAGTLTLSKVVIDSIAAPAVIRNNHNSLSNGGAIQNNGGTVLFEGGLISGCLSLGNGGAVYNDNGAVSGSPEAIRSNSAVNGGAIAQTGALGTINLSGGAFLLNAASENGGAIYVLDGLLTIKDSTIGYNVAALKGAGVYTNSSLMVGGNLIINENLLSDNTASNLYLAASGVSLNRISPMAEGSAVALSLDSANMTEGKTIVTSSSEFLSTDLDAFFLDDGTSYHLDFNEDSDRILLAVGAQTPHEPEDPITTDPDAPTGPPMFEEYAARVKHGEDGAYEYFEDWSAAVECANELNTEKPCEVVYVSILSDLVMTETTVVKTNWELTATYTSIYDNPDYTRYHHTYTVSTTQAVHLFEVSSAQADCAQLRIVSGNYINRTPSPDAVTIYADLSANTNACPCDDLNCECRINGICECDYGKISVFGSTIICEHGSAIVAHDALYMADYMDGLDETEGKHDSRTVIRSDSAADANRPAVVSSGGFISAGGSIEAAGGGVALSLTNTASLQATGITTTCVCTCAADCPCADLPLCDCEGAVEGGCRCSCDECDCGCDPATAKPAVEMLPYVGDSAIGLELAGCEITNTGVGPAILNNSANRILIREPVIHGQETRGNSIITGRIKTSPDLLFVEPGFFSSSPIPVELINSEAVAGTPVVYTTAESGVPDVNSFVHCKMDEVDGKNVLEYSALAEDLANRALVVTNRIAVYFKINYTDAKFSTYYIAEGDDCVYSAPINGVPVDLTPSIDRRVFLGWFYRYGGQDWMVIDADGSFVANACTENDEGTPVKVFTDDNGLWANSDLDTVLYAMWESAPGAIYKLTCEGGAYIIDPSGAHLTEGTYAANQLITVAAPEYLEYFTTRTTPFVYWSSSAGGNFEALKLPVTTFTMPMDDTVVTANYAAYKYPSGVRPSSDSTTSPPSDEATTSAEGSGTAAPGDGGSGDGSSGGGGGNVIKSEAWDFSNSELFNDESPIWLFSDPASIDPDDATGPDGYLGDPTLDGDNYYKVDIDIPIPQLGGTFDILLFTVIGIMISLTGAYISMKRYYASRVRWNSSYRGYY